MCKELLRDLSVKGKSGFEFPNHEPSKVQRDVCIMNQSNEFSGSNGNKYRSRRNYGFMCAVGVRVATHNKSADHHAIRNKVQQAARFLSLLFMCRSLLLRNVATLIKVHDLRAHRKFGGKRKKQHGVGPGDNY